jgi:nucleotide-binding universal stress UspA family protein
MFRAILLPIDLTDRHRRALDIAVRLARLGDGRVHLLHVIELIPGLDVDEERGFYDRLEQQARRHLELLGQHLAE